MRATLALALAPLLVQPVAAQSVDDPIVGTTVTDFESGTAGWTGPAGIGGATFIEPNGGNGGTAGLRTIFNDFGIAFTNDSNALFLGDLTQYASVTISIDVLVEGIQFFGAPVSRPWLLELRDFDTVQGNYPWTSVWFLFDNISSNNNSQWTTYSVTIADPTTTTLPAGWRGYGDEDPVTIEPILPAGVTFADVLSGVDVMAFSTLQPGFFFGFTDFDVIIDNVTISTTVTPVASGEVVRLGTPANDNAFVPGVTSGPVIGQTWDPVIDHTTFLPNATLDLAILGATTANVPVGAAGTLLCGLSGAVLLQSSPGQPFAVPLPNHPFFVGVGLCVQGASVSPTTGLRFANALDITIGSM